MKIAISSIYLITNKANSKKYVGFTTQYPPKMRWYKHVSLSKRPEHTDHTALHKAIRKYGQENFTFEIICQSKQPKYMLEEMEPYFIKKYGSYGRTGYNMTVGGDGILGHKHTKESKIKFSGKNHGMYNKTPWNQGKVWKEMQGENNPSISMRKSYHITFKDGHTEIITGFNKFCKERGYRPSCMNYLINGKLKSHKDIICIEKLLDKVNN